MGYSFQHIFRCLVLTTLSSLLIISILYLENNINYDKKCGGLPFKKQHAANLLSLHLQEAKWKKNCAGVKSKSLPKKHHFLINEEHKLLYCWIHKVASTSWTALFTHLANESNIHDLHRAIEVLSPKSSKLLLDAARRKDYFKILIVRHPFHRLVSAYRDRIYDNSKFTSQAWMYVPRVLSFTRPGLNRTQMFHHRKLVIVPTFEEFVRWLIAVSPEYYDSHWRHYTYHCSLCSIEYNVFIHIDNFTFLHEKAVMEYLGLNELNATVKHYQVSPGGTTDFWVTCEYFKQLSIEQINDLYSIFKIDFEMFNYTPHEYLKCARM